MARVPGRCDRCLGPLADGVCPSPLCKGRTLPTLPLPLEWGERLARELEEGRAVARGERWKALHEEGRAPRWPHRR